jgi:transcriptional regulator with XRE-family HTH domain
VARTPAPDELKRRFGQAVQALRHDLDVSQEELAARAEIHRTYLGDLERGNRNVALVNICRVAAALQVKPSALFQRMGM